MRRGRCDAIVQGSTASAESRRSQPLERVIYLINPVLRGWVNYFTVGHSSECFNFIQSCVEKKVGAHYKQPGPLTPRALPRFVA
jgi:RNA-directed DNA polymerase